MPRPALFGVPIELRAVVLSTEIFGIIANVFFLTMLVRYHRGWPSNKVLLVAYHTAALVFLLNRHFPFLVSTAMGRPMTAAECIAPALFTQLTGVFLPLCQAVMAHYRWKVVQAAKDGQSEPDVKRYIYGLLAVVAISVSIVQIVAEATGVRVLWTGMLCVRTYTGWSVLFNMSFFCTAPYLLYCYRKIITSIRSLTKDGGAEFVRLIYTLTVFYYITYLPFSVLFFMRYLARVRAPYLALQIAAWLFETHASFSPILSMTMIRRYRKMAYVILTGQTIMAISPSSYDGKRLSDSGGGNVRCKTSFAVVKPVPSLPEPFPYPPPAPVAVER